MTHYTPKHGWLITPLRNRQAMDKRAHRADIDVVDALLSASPLLSDAVLARESKRTMQSHMKMWLLLLL